MQVNQLQLPLKAGCSVLSSAPSKYMCWQLPGKLQGRLVCNACLKIVRQHATSHLMKHLLMLILFQDNDLLGQSCHPG